MNVLKIFLLPLFFTTTFSIFPQLTKAPMTEKDIVDTVVKSLQTGDASLLDAAYISVEAVGEESKSRGYDPSDMRMGTAADFAQGLEQTKALHASLLLKAEANKIDCSKLNLVSHEKVNVQKMDEQVSMYGFTLQLSDGASDIRIQFTALKLTKGYCLMKLYDQV
ncbi:MAG: hypothetical protein AAFV25_17700, partial [Bacteroidota bacterium]